MQGSPRKVLILLPYARWGGPGSLLATLLRHLERWQAVVVLPRGGEGGAKLEAAGARVLELDGLATMPRVRRPWQLGPALRHQATSTWRLVRLIRQERPALVHSFSEGLLTGGVAARLTGLPAVCQAIGMSIFQPPAVGLAVTALLGRLYDRILCAQPVIRDEFLACGAKPQRLTVLVNCIEPELVRQRAAAAGPARPPESLPVVAMVASMDRRKGHDLLIRAAGLLRQRGVGLRVRILGSVDDDPAFREELTGLVRQLGLTEQVELTGAVENVPAELARAQLYAVPSRSEALPVAGLEAMALGLPVVATRVGGLPYMVVHRETGLLCMPQDPDALADALAQLLQDPRRARTLGEAGRARVDRLFDAAVVAPRLEQVYDELTAGRS